MARHEMVLVSRKFRPGPPELLKFIRAQQALLKRDLVAYKYIF